MHRRFALGLLAAALVFPACKSSFDAEDEGAPGESEGEAEGAEGESGDGGGDDAPRFVAVGDGLTVHTTDEGQAWVIRTPSLPVDGRLEQAAYGNGVWVVVGGVADSYDTMVLRSRPDGNFDWVQNELDARSGVIFADGNFVAYGFETGRSSDGEAWATGASFSVSIEAMTYGSGRFVGVGGGVTAVSEDGLSWTETNLGGTNLLAVAHGAGVYVAVGEEGRVIRSTDGVNWEELPVLDTGVNSGVGHDGERFYISSGAEHYLWVSDDGSSFTNTGVQGHDSIAFSASLDRYVGVSGNGTRGYSEDLAGFIAAGESESAGYWSVSARE